MKIGYSILLGELIDSEKINYEDCKYYQIVCPECSEPVFKVNKTNEAKSSHYLSHYKSSKTTKETVLCELRVQNINLNDFKEKNAKSREQKLTFFLQVFASLLNDCINDEHKKIGKFLKKVKGYKVFENEIKSIVFSLASDKSDFYNISSQVVAGLRAEGNPIKSSFRIEKQTEVSWDLLRLLLTPKATVNLRLLIRFSFTNTLSVLHASKRVKGKNIFSIDSLITLLEKAVFNEKKETNEALKTMKNNKMVEQTTYFEKFSSAFKSQLVRSLLILPYFEFLQKNKA